MIDWLSGQINENNGFLDEAIANYEAVLATKIPDRGFDFSGDYEVLNLLARSLYNRARREPRSSRERLVFLSRSIAAYKKTLAIDSENVAAHYGLGLAYSEFGGPDYEVEWARAGDAGTTRGTDDRRDGPEGERWLEVR